MSASLNPDARSGPAPHGADDTDKESTAARVERFLGSQQGVLRAQARYDQTTRTVSAVVWVDDPPIGLPRSQLPDGTRITELDHHDTQSLYRDIFIDHLYLPHGITLRSDALVLDVGANIGLFSLYVTRHAPRVRVLAFEPSPDAFAALCDNVAAHGLPVTCVPWAMGGRNGQQTMTVYPAAAPVSVAGAVPAKTHSLRRIANECLRNVSRAGAVADDVASGLMDGIYELPVAMWSLPEVMATLGDEHVDLLKLTAEGNVLEILSALGAADWQRIDRLVVELHRKEETEP
jgi:FkbM family methyltransferase